MREMTMGSNALAQPDGCGLCAVEGCSGIPMFGEQVCGRCRQEIDALEEWTKKRNARSARDLAREEWIRRFIVVFLFTCAGEALLSAALGLSWSWAWLLIQMGWASLVAAFAAWVYRRNER